MKDHLPSRTVVRLSKYRQFLLQYRHVALPHIFSHDLARLVGSHPVQVRRDLMLMGISGNHRKGYDVTQLIDLINRTLEHGKIRKLAIVGYGRVGSAVMKYLEEHEHKFSVAAVFDIDPSLVGTSCFGVPCYPLEEMTRMIREKEIEIAVLSISDGPDTAEVVRMLAGAGITGILNFTSDRLEEPEGVYMKDSGLITLLDEVSYFAADRR